LVDDRLVGLDRGIQVVIGFFFEQASCNAAPRSLVAADAIVAVANKADSEMRRCYVLNDIKKPFSFPLTLLS